MSRKDAEFPTIVFWFWLKEKIVYNSIKW
jgi:hypothetical protein